jgi:hypothetical protein
MNYALVLTSFSVFSLMLGNTVLFNTKTYCVSPGVVRYIYYSLSQRRERYFEDTCAFLKALLKFKKCWHFLKKFGLHIVKCPNASTYKVKFQSANAFRLKIEIPT